MKSNNLDAFLGRISRKELCLGTCITMSDSTGSELAAEAGFDFTWIDMEHSPLTIRNVMHHVNALRGTKCAPLVRVQWNEWGVIKPVLDLAPAGVIIPMVNTAEAAVAAVASCRYPAAGVRGWAPRRGIAYGAKSDRDYYREAQSEPLILIQIEHIEAVGNIDEILAVPGLSGICVGPADLAASMGRVPDVEAPEVVEKLDLIAGKTKEAGLLLGAFSVNIPVWKKRGADYLAVCGDYSALFAQYKTLIDGAL